MSRAIVFAEVPSFYASVERADDPSLADRPIIVGGDPRKRGLVQDASPEALAAGVTVDMPVLDALELCPDARAVRTDMHRYREVSRRLFACLRRVFDSLEPFGLGGAYFELTGERTEPDRLAGQMRSAVAEELSLPLRVGIASGKFMARLAAEEAGQSGLRRLDPDADAEFVMGLPVTRLEGVGQKTAATLAELGATRIRDVVELGRERLQEALGTHGLRIHGFATGRDDRTVRAARHPQTLSRETTVGESLDMEELTAQLLELAQRLEGELREQSLTASRVSLKVRFSDRATTTRSQTLGVAISGAGPIHEAAVRLLARTAAGSRPARGLGIALGRLAPEAERDRQLDLFPR